MHGGFFIGLHQPSDARHFARCCISVNRLRHRRSFDVQEWMMDSGAFTEVAIHGGYRQPVEAYADEVRRWAGHGQLVAAVSQDFMCEPFVLQRTGLTTADHQAMTIDRYRALVAAVGAVAYVMPVLQGYAPSEYADHVRQYGALLARGQWVGVGSVCKRNGDPQQIVAVLRSIYDVRPDLRLHGFGLKQTALASGVVQAMLWSADSMAWSFAARREGRNANDWREADAYVRRIEQRPTQPPLFLSDWIGVAP